MALDLEPIKAWLGIRKHEPYYAVDAVQRLIAEVERLRAALSGVSQAPEQPKDELKLATSRLTNRRLAVNDWVACSTQEQLQKWRQAQQALIEAAKRVGALEAAGVSQAPPQAIADELRRLMRSGEPGIEQGDFVRLRWLAAQVGVMSMAAQSDPHAPAEKYRQALIEICNLSLRIQDTLTQQAPLLAPPQAWQAEDIRDLTWAVAKAFDNRPDICRRLFKIIPPLPTPPESAGEPK